jgi:hypothetical protein
VIVAAAAALGLSACQPCAVRPPEVVHIPITECPAPPHELLMPISIGDLPVFVPPTDAQAVSALTPAGEDRLREIVTTIAERERQCRAWLEISTVREKP